MKKNILVITTWFPSIKEPLRCVFTKNILDAQAQSTKYSFVVISPVPYFKDLKLFLVNNCKLINRSKNITTNVDKYRIYRPKYFKLPFTLFIKYEIYAYYLSVLNTIKKKNINFDLIHCHGVFPDGCVALKIGKYFNKKVVLHVHDSCIADNNKTNTNNEKVMAQVDKLLPVSRFQMNEIAKIDNELLKKCEVIYNGVKVNQADNIHKIIKMPCKGKRKLIFIGNLLHVKGVDILIEALTYLNDYNFSLDIVGNGKLKGEYKSLVKKFRLEHKVNFLNEIANDILINKISEYDFLVVPSRHETFGIALIEAMSCGLPVVSSKVGAIQEIITSGEVGILVEPENPESLAKGIIQAFSKTWDSNKIKEHAKKFSIDNTVQKIENVYEELVNK